MAANAHYPANGENESMKTEQTWEVNQEDEVMETQGPGGFGHQDTSGYEQQSSGFEQEYPSDQGFEEDPGPGGFSEQGSGNYHQQNSFNQQQQTTPTSQESSEDIPYDNHKLFVGGLNSETTSQFLKEYFGKYGTIADFNLKMDPVSRKSRGFAFVIFNEPDAVDKVLSDGPHMIDGKKVDAKKSIPHEVHQKLKARTKKIFVGGVPVDMPEHAIREYFLQFGSIDEVALVTEKGDSSKRRGFVFVTFDDESYADKACEVEEHYIGETKIEVKRATPRDQDGGHGHYGGGRGNYYGGGRGRGGGGGNYGYHPAGRGGFQPYGGYAYYGFYGPPPGFGGPPYMGGGGNQYHGYGQSNNSKYGPMRSYGHSHGHGGNYHPYNRY